MSLPDGVKFDDMCISFDTIQYQRVTYGRTDRLAITISRAQERWRAIIKLQHIKAANVIKMAQYEIIKLSNISVTVLLFLISYIPEHVKNSAAIFS